MTLYSVAASFSAYLGIRLLVLLGPFSDENRWTIVKEFISIYLVLQLMGIAIYFAAFIIEETSWEYRWNFPTFLDSCKYSFYIGIFPFLFFTSMNYRFLLVGKEVIYDHAKNPDHLDSEAVVNIISKLKRESLSFHPGELLYVCSDGNYVEFYLYRNEKLEKTPIRNSISDIEKQFADIPYYFRSHRAYIVNLNKVVAKKGNSLGYQLSISNCTWEVPVSRQHVKTFDGLFH